jgi:hypothetical protein
MDIVKRLRAMDEEQFYQAPATSYRDCQEAADEIERLRAQTRAFAKAIVEGDEPFGGEEWEALLQAAEATNKHPD